jgi:hypothetical protein
MIPIVSVSNIITFLALLFVTWRLYFSYIKTKTKAQSYFLKAFISFSAASLIFAPNGIIIKDLKVISLIFDIYPFLLFLGVGYMIALALQTMAKETLRKIIFFLVLVYGFFLSLIPILHLQPAVENTQGIFVFWEDTRGAEINNLIGLGLGIMLLWLIFLFLHNGLRLNDKYAKTRSFMLSAGLTCLLLGSITDYVFAADTNIFYISIYTTFWYLLAMGLTLFAVEYKKEQNFL